MAKSYHKGSWNIKLRDFEKLKGSIEAVSEGTKKALRNTVSDLHARAPGWIATEVTGVYGIKKSEITPSRGKNAKPKKMAGYIKVKGETVESITILYEGRLLTPVHFSMTPKTAPKGKKYTLKAKIKKGQSEIIGRYYNTRTPGGPFSKRSHNILMGTGAKTEGKVGAIPFQRMSENRKDIKKLTTLSMPQMITSDLVAPAIREKLNQGLADRLEHNMRRQLGIK